MVSLSKSIHSIMKKLLIFFSCLIFCVGCSVPATIVTPDSNPVEVAEKESQIEQLKDGFLLVRLRSIEKQLQMLRYRRERTAAYRLRNETKKTNAHIVQAFHENYDFSKVYYFYSKHSGRIRKHELDSIVLDYEMLPVDSALIADKSFLVAEFAEIQPPAEGSGLPALIVRDEQLIQLKKPFPFYVRTAVLGDDSQEVAAVKQLNKQLKEFYQESTDK